VQLILIDEKTYFLIDGKTYFLIVLDLGIRDKSIEWFLPALVRTVICATESPLSNWIRLISSDLLRSRPLIGPDYVCRREPPRDIRLEPAPAFSDGVLQLNHIAGALGINFDDRVVRISQVALTNSERCKKDWWENETTGDKRARQDRPTAVSLISEATRAGGPLGSTRITLTARNIAPVSSLPFPLTISVRNSGTS
jgi:hypothetical protein